VAHQEISKEFDGGGKRGELSNHDGADRSRPSVEGGTEALALPETRE